ncbi:hypothetical protein DL96DRAFT_1687067 [Flagelloscypha sp. PMI_526]|nr:hypothetical protein DL96DRAFT_1687067 [Flagelloscypha sp. PMI_526]
MIQQFSEDMREITPYLCDIWELEISVLKYTQLVWAVNNVSSQLQNLDLGAEESSEIDNLVPLPLGSGGPTLSIKNKTQTTIPGFYANGCMKELPAVFPQGTELAWFLNLRTGDITLLHLSSGFWRQQAKIVQDAELVAQNLIALCDGLGHCYLRLSVVTGADGYTLESTDDIIRVVGSLTVGYLELVDVGMHLDTTVDALTKRFLAAVDGITKLNAQVNAIYDHFWVPQQVVQWKKAGGILWYQAGSEFHSLHPDLSLMGLLLGKPSSRMHILTTLHKSLHKIVREVLFLSVSFSYFLELLLDLASLAAYGVHSTAKSRDELDIHTCFSGKVSTDFAIEKEMVHHDIVVFVDQELSTEKWKSWPKREVVNMRNALIGKADGMTHTLLCIFFASVEPVSITELSALVTVKLRDPTDPINLLEYREDLRYHEPQNIIGLGTALVR